MPLGINGCCKITAFSTKISGVVQWETTSLCNEQTVKSAKVNNKKMSEKRQSSGVQKQTREKKKKEKKKMCVCVWVHLKHIH